MTQNIRASLIALNVLMVGALGVALAWPADKRIEFRGFGGDQVPKTLTGAATSYEATQDLPIDKAAQIQLSAASMVSRQYRETGANASPIPLSFTLIGGTDRSIIHDPRSCFQGSGWVIDNDHNEMLPGTNVGVHSCIIRDPEKGEGFDVIYLYVVDGGLLNKVTQVRAEMVWNAFMGSSKRPTFFFRCVRSISPEAMSKNGGIADDEHKKLQDFSAAMWQSIGPELLKMRSQ